MSSRHLPCTRGTVALLVALDDGRIAVAPDGTLPTTELPPGDELLSGVRRLEDRLGLPYAAAPRLAATDTTTARDAAVAEHRVVWHGILPASWTAAPHRMVPVGQVLAALPLPEASRLRAACRAGLLGDTVRLVSGRRSGVRAAKAERTQARFTWYPGPHTATGHEVRQVWGWLIDPAGRVLVLLDRFDAPSLPGGRPETGETPAATLSREAAEEASARLGAPMVLGFQRVDERDRAPYTQLRMAAPLLELGPAAPDVDSGETYRRVLVPVRQANLLLGWGPEGDTQAAAAAVAYCRDGAPPAALRHIQEQGWTPASTEEAASEPTGSAAPQGR